MGRIGRIQSWLFTPRGALVYFGVGYAGIIAIITLIFWAHR